MSKMTSDKRGDLAEYKYIRIKVLTTFMHIQMIKLYSPFRNFYNNTCSIALKVPKLINVCFSKHRLQNLILMSLLL